MTKRVLEAVLVLLLAAAALVPSGALAEPADCNDAVDNDADGLIDYPDDPGCSEITDNSELDPVPECRDGLDNDNDGSVDHPADTSCESPEDASERASCSDDGSARSCLATNLTIRYVPLRRAFGGAVGHSLKACVSRREVVVYLQTPGPDEALGSLLTNRRGTWWLRTWERLRGRFYAKTPQRVVTHNGQEVVCVEDRSVTIRLRG